MALNIIKLVGIVVIVAWPLFGRGPCPCTLSHDPGQEGHATTILSPDCCEEGVTAPGLVTRTSCCLPRPTCGIPQATSHPGVEERRVNTRGADGECCDPSCSCRRASGPLGVPSSVLRLPDISQSHSRILEIAPFEAPSGATKTEFTSAGHLEGNRLAHLCRWLK